MMSTAFALRLRPKDIHMHPDPITPRGDLRAPNKNR
jgi:hypothetical protein